MKTKKEQQPLLKVSQLGVIQGNTTILKHVDWTVSKGEHWAILGANGSGKTSLLAAIMLYLTPTSGEVECMGANYGEADWQEEVRSKIGMVSSALTRRVPADEPVIETVLSGATSQLGYWTRARKVDARSARACLRKMGVQTLESRTWGALSQGERQKVFIARALMAKLSLLILDEPCAGLDPVAREHFLQSLRKLAVRRAAPGLVLVTHHVEEIFPEISHVLILHKGTVLAAGEKQAVLNSKNLSVAFDATVRLSKSKACAYKLSVLS